MLNFVRSGWGSASGKQKGAIVFAIVLASGTLANVGRPSQTGVATVIATRSAGATPTSSPFSALGSTPSPTAIAPPTPEPTPTDAPMATAEPRVTPTAAPKATAAPTLALAFTSLTSPAPRNSLATAAVKTSPGANCTIVVQYKSGPSKAAGLDPHVADGSGVASWTWKVGANTTLGTWPVTVKCAADGQTMSVTKSFQVV